MSGKKWSIFPNFGEIEKPDEEKPIVETHRKPENLSDKSPKEILNNGELQCQLDRDIYIEVYHNDGLQNILTCYFCKKYLCVAPIFYEKNQLYKACGRCHRDPASEVHAHEMLRDHLYEALLPFLMFGCCREKLTWHEMEKHEKYCTFKAQTHHTMDNRELDKNINISNKNFDFFALPTDEQVRTKWSCSACAKLLSVFPVVSNGKRTICGRCNKQNWLATYGGSDWTEQVIYKTMAKFIKFPCHDCTLYLKIDELEEHESNCRYTKMPCPLPLCTQSIRAVEMSMHVRREHMYECFQTRLKLHKVEEQTFLANIDSELYIVAVEAVKDEQHKLSCAVFGIDDKDYENVLLEIFETGVDDQLESIQIQVAKFASPAHPVQIRRRNTNACLRLVRFDDDAVALNEETSWRFECKVCYTYMTRKIYMCENRHPICAPCKTRVASCPTCRGMLGARRHSLMETEAAKIRFPCRNRDDNGCDVVATPKHLVQHELRCGPGVPRLACFIPSQKGCDFKILSDQHDDVLNHCARHHPTTVMCQRGKAVLEWPRALTNTDLVIICQYRVLFFDGEYFLVNVKCRFGAFKTMIFCVRQMGMACSKRYRYTVELHMHGRIVEREGTCGVASEAQIMLPKLILKTAVIDDMTHVYGDLCSLPYRVKLEKI